MATSCHNSLANYYCCKFETLSLPEAVLIEEGRMARLRIGFAESLN
jgi:hypothetical protein